jgi:hypothetical protein
MAASAVNRVGGAVAAIGCVLGAVGLLGDTDNLLVIGGGLVTAASLLAALRLWQWAKAVRSQGRPMRAWEVRPGFLVALLVLAIFMALAFLDAGRPEIAAWTVPAAVLLVGQAMLRAGLMRDHLK